MCTSCSASTASSGAESMSELSYRVAGMTCSHCTVSVSEEVSQVRGVQAVDVDLGTKLVRVRGSDLDDAAIRAAIDEAGYEGVPA